MSWFDKLMPSRIRTEQRNRRSVPEGLWDRDRHEQERESQPCIDDTHEDAVGPATEVSAEQPDSHPDQTRDSDSRETDHQRDSGAVDES